MKKKSKDILLTPCARHGIMNEKGGVNYMTKDMERFTLRLPKWLKGELEKTSDNLCVSLNAVVIQILRDWVDNRPKAG